MNRGNVCDSMVTKERPHKLVLTGEDTETFQNGGEVNRREDREENSGTGKRKEVYQTVTSQLA